MGQVLAWITIDVTAMLVSFFCSNVLFVVIRLKHV